MKEQWSCLPFVECSLVLTHSWEAANTVILMLQTVMQTQRKLSVLPEVP
jgi:hypothetical protein